MIEWFVGLSLIGKIWVIYPVLPALIFALAIYIETVAASKVDGAGGWFLFAAIMIGGYSFLLVLLLTGLIWLVQLLL
jgi:hypothetical protein